MGKDLSNAALLAEMGRFFGPARAAKFMGWLMLAALNGIEHRDQLPTGNWASQATRYRVAMDVRDFRVFLAAAGYDLTDDELIERVIRPRGVAVA